MSDLLPILLGVLCWPAILFAPGYAISLLFQPLGARECSLARRVLLAVPVSLASMPIIAYLVWKYIGVVPLSIFLGVCSLITLGHLIIHRCKLFEILRKQRFFVLAAIVWLIGSLLIIVPVQLNDKLFLSITWGDYAKHIAVTNAITRTGVPPVQPYFYPGEARPTFYYYGWFLQSSLVDRWGGERIGPDHAVFAGIIWTGIGLAAALLLVAKTLVPSFGIDPVRRDRAIVLLMLVTGLDFIPVFLRHMAVWASGAVSYYYSTEWWNDQVTGWIDMMLWVPQHVGGAVAAMLGLILLRRAADEQRWSLLSIALAAISLASCALMSIYLAMATAVIAMVWLVVCLARRNFREVIIFIAGGVAAALLASPFLLELFHAKSTDQLPIAFQVRLFGPVETVLRNTRFATPLITQILSLILLPLNYAIEFGVYALTAWLYWRWRKREQKAMNNDDRFAITWVISIGVFASFVRSSLALNDLGWRSFIPVQAILIVWAADLWQRRASLGPWLQMLLKSMLIIGLASTIYDLWLIRTGSIQRHLRKSKIDDVELLVNARDAHAWIARNTPRDAVVQYRPLSNVGYVHGSFGRRQVAVGDPIYGSLLGISPAIYESWRERTDAIFAQQFLSPEDRKTIADLKIDYLLVLWVDELWFAPSSVRSAVVYQNPRCAVIDVKRLPQ